MCVFPYRNWLTSFPLRITLYVQVKKQCRAYLLYIIAQSFLNMPWHSMRQWGGFPSCYFLYYFLNKKLFQVYLFFVCSSCLSSKLISVICPRPLRGEFSILQGNPNHFIFYQKNISSCSWARIFSELFSKRCTFGQKWH